MKFRYLVRRVVEMEVEDTVETEAEDSYDAEVNIKNGEFEIEERIFRDLIDEHEIDDIEYLSSSYD